ncbi:TldD/PmbA family protein [Acanthopleuribacter pedis]|uniref:Uncharacterized protein n=1 Tax=Acanthopleuribacter pedis TaxID=442870 RepID=A0A8J7U455_9BACT|nr:metallopeptidase TldD-related protein [Acanthopleuribacter pedis]MBO1321138.1 hypothetical protein [Acanthopleuribacter pedis]
MKQYADLKELEEKARDVLQMARDKGADTAECQIMRRRDFEVEVRNGEIENLSEAEPFEMSLTVSQDYRRASVSTCDLTPDSIRGIVDQAMVLSKYTDRDTFYTLPKPEQLATEFKDLDLFDAGLLDMPVTEKIELARELENHLLAVDERLKSDGASFSSTISAAVVANSAGFCKAEQRTLLGMGVSGFADDQVKEGDLNVGRKQSGSWGSQRRHRADLRGTKETAQRAANNVLRKIGARKPQTGTFPCYFEPTVARSIWSNLLAAMTGGAVYRNESFLIDQLEQQVCSDIVTITEDPFIPRGQSSRNYDREGVAKKAAKLIEKGRLNTWLLGSYSANKLGKTTTGHAGGTANLLIEPGPFDEAGLLKEMGTGIWVISLLGQGVNISTGDFSRAALGLWVENGEVQYPVMEFTLNSNLKDMLKNISHMGNNVMHDWSVQTPGFIIGNMNVSGL